MVTRILHTSEYPRLVGTELEAVWPYLPDTAQVLVVEDDGAIVGCWALYPLWHVEGVYVAPTHRKTTVARRLLRGMRQLAAAQAVRAVNTGAMTDEVAGMLTRLGAVELPGRHFALAMGAR